MGTAVHGGTAVRERSRYGIVPPEPRAVHKEPEPGEGANWGRDISPEGSPAHYKLALARAGGRKRRRRSI